MYVLLYILDGCLSSRAPVPTPNPAFGIASPLDLPGRADTIPRQQGAATRQSRGGTPALADIVYAHGATFRAAHALCSVGPGHPR